MARPSSIGVIAGRELVAYFHAPIAHVAGVVFLLLQGFSFWALVAVLSDPSRPAPLGAVLANHFGGTLLYWSVLLLYVALLSMRLVAEERQTKTWESLLTASVSEEQVLLGKWLGGVGFYTLLWLPTMAYPGVLWLYADTVPDLGPIVAAYAGVLLSGMALMAVGLAASAITANQVVAASLTYACLMAIFLLGQLRELTPQVFARWELLGAVVDYVDMRAHMLALGRGHVSLSALVWFGSLTVTGLAAAQICATRGRRRPAEMRRRALALVLVVIICACMGWLSERHPLAWDVSKGGSNTLSARTLEVLDAVTEPVRVLHVQAEFAGFAAVDAEVERLLGRMAAAQPGLVRERLDPALAPGRVAALAGEFALDPTLLAEGGAVVFQQGQRRRIVDLFDIANFDSESGGGSRVAQLRAEQAFTDAVAEVISAAPITICHTVGHGEMALSRAEVAPAVENDVDRPHWHAIGDRAMRDGMELRAVSSLAGEIPGPCRVLVIAGPERPLSGREAQTVARYLERGGRLFLALSERIDVVSGAGAGASAATVPAAAVRAASVRARAAASGLELVLMQYGIEALPAVVLDPTHTAGDSAAWLTVNGYGDGGGDRGTSAPHPVVASFAGRRYTLWLTPRALQAVTPANTAGTGTVAGTEVATLVSSSASGWGETDLESALLGQSRASAADLAGPVAVAMAARDRRTGARIVVVGSAVSLSSVVSVRDVAGNELLGHAALSWLSGRRIRTHAGGDGDAPEQVRLSMTDAERAWVFVLCVVLMPGGLALLAALSWWRRRRGQ